MNQDLLKVIRNVLFRTVAVCFCLNLLMVLATLGFWDTWSQIAAQWFRMPANSMGPVMLEFFAQVKFYVIYVLLAPALALHWTISRST